MFDKKNLNSDSLQIFENINSEIVNSNSIENEYSIQDELKEFIFNGNQKSILKMGMRDIQKIGGPDAKNAHKKAILIAGLIINNASDFEQISILHEYISGKISALTFNNLPFPSQDNIPNQLAQLEVLEKDTALLELASRSQILLALVQNRAFAYDIDNEGKIVRLVGNFNGGGIKKMKNEDTSKKINLSSHSGVALGAHTEAPYHSTILPSNGHSPAPSTLILTARYNPKNEPTKIIPIASFLRKLDWKTILGLTLPVFSFTRSDSFVTGKGEGAVQKSLLDIDEKGRITFKFNIYRVYTEDNAPQIAKNALEDLICCVNSIQPITINLQSDSAIVIDNYKSLHCRDILNDNRRLLLRLFGYSCDAEAIVISKNPLLVKG